MKAKDIKKYTGEVSPGGHRSYLARLGVYRRLAERFLEGYPTRVSGLKIARDTGAPVNSVRRAITAMRAHFNLPKGRPGGGNYTLPAKVVDFIKRKFLGLRKGSTIYLVEAVKRIEKETGVRIGISSLAINLKQMGSRRKGLKLSYIGIFVYRKKLRDEKEFTVKSPLP